MGFLDRLLDEVSTLSPTLGELRWGQLQREYEREIEREKTNSTIRSSTPKKKTTSSSTTINRGTQKRKITEPDASERITQSQFQSMVKESCYKIKKKYSDLFIPSPKLERKLQIPTGEEIYLEYDDSLLRDGTYGFAVTSTGIYAKEFLGGPYYVSFQELSIYKVQHRMNTAYVNNKLVMYIMPSEKEPEKESAGNSIVRLYNKIGKEYIKVK